MIITVPTRRLSLRTQWIVVLLSNWSMTLEISGDSPVYVGVGLPSWYSRAPPTVI